MLSKWRKPPPNDHQNSKCFSNEKMSQCWEWELCKKFLPQRNVFSKESNITLSLPHRPILIEYITLKKEDTKSTSQSYTNLIKLMTQCTSSLLTNKLSSTIASLSLAMQKYSIKVSIREWSHIKCHAKTWSESHHPPQY